MNSSQTELSIAAETTWGELPSPAAFQAIRITGESLKITNESVVSEEIRPDRNVPDTILVGGQASGGINGELSYGTFDQLFESVLFSAFTGSPAVTLINGVAQKSFHIQKKQEGNGLAAVYELYKGMVADSVTLNIAAKEKMTLSVSFVGKGGEIKTTETGTITDADSSEIFDGANAFALTKAWTSPLPKLMSMSITINNGLAGRSVAGSRDLARVSAGRCSVTGSADFYFETKAMMDLFLAGTGGELEVTLGKDTGEKYTISMPNVKITDADHFSPNNSDDVMLKITWQALYDETLDGTIEITRAVA